MKRVAKIALASLGVLGGCSADNGLTMGRVSGTVTYQGEPIESGQVLFAPDESKGTVGVPAMAKINPDGTYTLSTQDPGDGAIVGFHRVGIRGLVPKPGGDGEKAEAAAGAPKSGQSIFAARAKAARAAGRVRRTNPEKATITINGQEYQLSTPSKLANPNVSGILVQVSRGSNTIDLAIQEDGSVKIQP